MLKTNSKATTNAVKKYIINSCINADSGEGFKCFSSSARFIWDKFKTEKGCHASFSSFASWAQGLPSCGLFDYYVRYPRDAQEILAEILKQTKEETQKFEIDQSEILLTYLIYKTIYKEISKR